MEDLAVEVCGKNGAHYKVGATEWKAYLPNFLNTYWTFISQGYVKNIHQDQVTISLQHEYVCRDFAFVIHCLPSHNARLQFLCFLFSNRPNNCRRVPYEEVRLPPTSNQRCDLYVDDEVEVRMENLFLYPGPMWSNCERSLGYPLA